MVHHVTVALFMTVALMPRRNSIYHYAAVMPRSSSSNGSRRHTLPSTLIHPPSCIAHTAVLPIQVYCPYMSVRYWDS